MNRSYCQVGQDVPLLFLWVYIQLYLLEHSTVLRSVYFETILVCFLFHDAVWGTNQPPPLRQGKAACVFLPMVRHGLFHSTCSIYAFWPAELAKMADFVHFSPISDPGAKLRISRRLAALVNRKRPLLWTKPVKPPWLHCCEHNGCCTVPRACWLRSLVHFICGNFCKSPTDHVSVSLTKKQTFITCWVYGEECSASSQCVLVSRSLELWKGEDFCWRWGQQQIQLLVQSLSEIKCSRSSGHCLIKVECLCCPGQSASFSTSGIVPRAPCIDWGRKHTRSSQNISPIRTRFTWCSGSIPIGLM